ATFQGVRIPVRGVVRWQLASGDFDYYRWQIDAVSYEPAALARTSPGTAERLVVERSSQTFVAALQLLQ
ncbi:MAG TPA: hypothetical protein VJR89_10295, partial [Polyangiales bacterium]|nr:hypothetical protein [Polyangiales bacterium]